MLYRLADDQVARFLVELRALAHAWLAEASQGGAGLPQRRGFVVIDVRPSEEYAAGHIAGAIMPSGVGRPALATSDEPGVREDRRARRR